MTSRRAQRRTRQRASVASMATTSPAPAPGRELERWRPAEMVTRSPGAALAAAIRRVPGSTEPESERAARLATDALHARLLAANWIAGDPARLGYGLLPWWKVARVEVPPDLRRDLVIGAGHPTECYQRALTYVLDHHDHDVVLVHGLVNERGRLWGHGWVEIAGTVVWCPTTGEFLDLPDYYRVLQPAIFDAYTPAEAAVRAIAKDSAGPWWPRELTRYDAVIAEAVAMMLDSYERMHPGPLEWVRRMRSCDGRFAHDLECLARDPTAVVDLLAELVERPDLWRSHEPGTPWPYRLRKRPKSAEVIFPEIT